MNIIVISNKPYNSDFRKYLMRAASRQGATAIHLCSGKEMTLTYNEKVVAVYSSVTPIKIILSEISKIVPKGKTIILVALGLSARSIPFIIYLKKSSLKPIIFYDVFDYLRYGVKLSLFLRKLIVDFAWRIACHRTLVLEKDLKNLYPGGLHFNNASHLVPSLTKPAVDYCRVVYIGSIDERVDFEWLNALAEQNITLDIYGCIHKNNAEIEHLLNDFLKRRQNATFHGGYDNDNLPAILENYHVGVMPYKTNHTLTKHVNPDKVYHYLNAGLKVIASPIPQTERMSDFVSLAKTREEILEALNGLPKSQKSSIWPAAQYSWDHRWQELEGIAQSMDRR